MASGEVCVGALVVLLIVTVVGRPSFAASALRMTGSQRSTRAMEKPRWATSAGLRLAEIGPPS